MGGESNGELLFNGYRVCDGEKVVEMDLGGCTTS